MTVVKSSPGPVVVVISSSKVPWELEPESWEPVKVTNIRVPNRKIPENILLEIY